MRWVKREHSHQKPRKNKAWTMKTRNPSLAEWQGEKRRQRMSVPMAAMEKEQAEMENKESSMSFLPSLKASA